MDPLVRIARDYAGQTARLSAVITGIERAVAKSFVSHPVAHRTSAEETRRIDICASWFVKLRHECGYSSIRASDCLEDCLRADLSGSAYTPSTRDSWAASAKDDQDRIILLG